MLFFFPNSLRVSVKRFQKVRAVSRGHHPFRRGTSASRSSPKFHGPAVLKNSFHWTMRIFRVQLLDSGFGHSQFGGADAFSADYRQTLKAFSQKHRKQAYD